MAYKPDHDFVLQFRGDVLRDMQARGINASLVTNLTLASPISRVLAQTVPPFQMKAHWANPGLRIAEDAMRLSADVAGGARYAVEGVNLTVKGPVSAEGRPTVAADDAGRPVVRLTTPSPAELRLDDLELSYAGDDDLLSWQDTALEGTLLRPTLCAQLLAPLANLPLTCLPDAVPLRLSGDPGRRGSPADGLMLTDPAVSLDPGADSLTLALRCAPRLVPPVPSPSPPDLLAGHRPANAVVALSETALNSTLDWLCAQGLATGSTPSPDGAVAWRWERVAVRFTDQADAVHVTGLLRLGERATVVDTELPCRPTGTDVLRDAWAHLLRRTFCAAPLSPGPERPGGVAPGPGRRLLQRFVIPGLDLATEAPMVDLGLRRGYLVASYAIPPDGQPVALTLEEDKPEPAVIQLDTPLQEAPGVAVTTQLAATLPDSRQAPHDFVWRVNQEPRPRRNHGPTLTVTATPPPTVPTGEPQKLATVTLKVIDILGQVGETEADAMYYPAAALDQDEPPDGGNGTASGLGVPDLPATVARLYRKWKDRAKGRVTVLRMTGLAAAAVVAAIIGLIAVPVGDGPPRSAQPPPEPTPTTTAQTTPAQPAFPSGGDPAAPPGDPTAGNTRTDPNGRAGPPGPLGPPSPANSGDRGAGDRGSGDWGSGDRGSGDPRSGGTGPVQVRTEGAGTVTSRPDGISCPPTCSAGFPTGTAVELTADPLTDSVFGGWSGSCTGTDRTCRITIPGAGADIAGAGITDITATFIPKPQLTVEVSEGGSVTGGGIACPPTCSVLVDPGESVTLTAQADSYYNFGGWFGNNPGTCTGSAPTCTVVMNGDRAVAAEFRSEIAPFLGTWQNTDSETDSITQVRLTQTSPSTATLQVWGACVPTWCDWGTTTATLVDGGLEAFYDHGYATHTLFITHSDGQLVVQTHTHFTDDSGREDFDSTDIMEKA